MDQDDDDAVERAQQGDVDAFARLVSDHRKVALRVAYSISPADAEDVVQDAFVKAYRALPRFRLGSPFRPWLLRIVTNEARNSLRRDGRQSALAVRDAGRRETSGWTTPEDDAIADEQRRHLADAVATLSPGDREVIALRWFAGLSELEMAAVLGCRPGTVKSRLSRALGRLRAALPEEAVR